jgi:flagellin-like hook-associated protein FlgL
MGLAGVASILWREREALELLLFKLEEEQLVLAAGRTKWLAHATREVEIVLDRIRQTEVLRAIEVDAVAAALGLPPNPSLTELADATPAPWNELLCEHRKALLTLTAEISALAEANRDPLTAGQRSSGEAMLAVTDSIETYGRRGHTMTGPPRPRPAALGDDLDRFDTTMHAMQGQLADVGGRYNRLAQLGQAATDQQLNVQSQLSDVEDVDLPKTIMEIQLQQIAYQAALAATARVVQPSLVDFLR